jgi:hypothetical protein
MVFNSGEILQLTTPRLDYLFIAGMVVAILYFLAPIFLRKRISDQNGNTLPPGPPVRYAFLRKYPELALDNWAKKYGPIFSLWMGTQLSSSSLILTLLEISLSLMAPSFLPESGIL